MKNPALRETLRPLQRLVVEARKDHKTKILEHEFNQTKTKIQKELLQTRIKKALRGGLDVDALRDEFGARGKGKRRAAPTRFQEGVGGRM